MRPVRLELSGFTAFRDPTTVDFEGADLFVLTGPTGSGKSSVIDAIVFTLYGGVPRLDRRAVAPVVSLGRTEARLKLDFTVAGAEYTAVRVVRRTSKGATTKEARLEAGDGTVLAGNEKELTAEVTRLLGLDFGHFTTCVVLPQGEFANLLHAEPSRRQDLLVSLLDLGLYERMARMARSREQTAERQAEVAATLLDKLADATPTTRSAAARRADALADLCAELEAAGPRLTSLRADEQAARAEAVEAAARVTLLAGVVIPVGLSNHAEAIADARAEVERAEVAEADAAARLEGAEDALGAWPSRAELERVIDWHHRRDALRAMQARGSSRVAECRSAEAEAADALAEADDHVGRAIAAGERARWQHRAHDLEMALEAGAACPVCRRTVETVPPLGPVVALDEVTAALSDAQAVADRVRRSHRFAHEALTEAEVRLATVAEQLVELDGLLVARPSLAEIEGVLFELTAAEATERRARHEAGVARRAHSAAGRARQQAEAAEVAARRALDDRRDRVAVLAPPTPGRTDLTADWQELADWAAVQQPIVAEAALDARARADGMAAEHAAVVADGDRRCREAGVEIGRRAPLTAAADAAARAAAEVEAIDRALGEAAGHRLELDRLRRVAAVARELARLLSANHFEAWVLDEALGLLVEGATDLLRDLSGGAYSLALDTSSSFLVIDHRNADEPRSARTLSGGETFLASLALALALADHVGSLASHGAARLESMFLDEGFGTLDPDALDIVAGAIEELGARGRMVGLISHVPELAERVPVRFEVTKTANSATVKRVLA